MPEDFLYFPERRAAHHHVAGRGVPQVVKPKTRSNAVRTLPEAAPSLRLNTRPLLPSVRGSRAIRAS